MIHAEREMDRRTFLGALPLSAEALKLQIPKATDLTQPSNASPDPSFPPGVSYFTEEKLSQFVDTSASLENIPFQAICYNFPSWHPSPAQEKYLGQGWTEWETVKHAKPAFPGHIQPKRPLWGYFNEADPAWAEREIEAASRAGIHAWMIDWYWHMGKMWYQEELEQGFLRARNRQKLRFAIMWANHDWLNLYPAPEIEGKPALLYPQTYSVADMERLADYLLEHYLHQPNYWRIDGQPVFAIFNVDGNAGILKHFGVEKLRKIFDQIRNRVAKAGLKGLHIQASHVYNAGQTPLKEAGFDSATRYQTIAGGKPGSTSYYGEGIESSIQMWKTDHQKVGLPYFPDCPIGWDNSPRYARRAHIVIHRTPDQFELFLKGAKYFAASTRVNPPVVFLSSWNEWTEDHYLLPDEVYGYSYLEAVRRQFAHS
jgi:hypothetical protein